MTTRAVDIRLSAIVCLCLLVCLPHPKRVVSCDVLCVDMNLAQVDLLKDKMSRLSVIGNDSRKMAAIADCASAGCVGSGQIIEYRRCGIRRRLSIIACCVTSVLLCVCVVYCALCGACCVLCIVLVCVLCIVRHVSCVVCGVPRGARCVLCVVHCVICGVRCAFVACRVWRTTWRVRLLCVCCCAFVVRLLCVVCVVACCAWRVVRGVLCVCIVYKLPRDLLVCLTTVAVLDQLRHIAVHRFTVIACHVLWLA